ncbi:MAG: hypothetical protein KIT31_07440 [Deltaproteobacteria bacterium]|nr:hypothetical protein [Deltaproteobacteria bacterium]
MPRTCDALTIRQHRELAVTRYTETDRFCEVANVLVLTSPNPGKLVFRALNVRNEMTDYVVPWDDELVYAPCPSTLPSSATPSQIGPLPATGATGSLWVDKTWAAGTDIKSSIPKWPLSFAAGDVLESVGSFYKPVKVWVARVIVEGTELETGNAYTGAVDLADAFYARPGQTLTCEGGVAPLDLTADGCGAGFNVQFGGGARLESAIGVIQASARHTNADVAAALRTVAAYLDGPHVSPADLEALTRLIPSLAGELPQRSSA